MLRSAQCGRLKAPHTIPLRSFAPMMIGRTMAQRTHQPTLQIAPVLGRVLQRVQPGFLDQVILVPAARKLRGQPLKLWRLLEQFLNRDGVVVFHKQTDNWTRGLMDAQNFASRFAILDRTP